MKPSLTDETAQPWCVHRVLNALMSPAVGWVSTTFCAATTMPPPTGTSETAASSLPPALDGVLVELGAEPAAPPDAAPSSAPEPHAAAAAPVTAARPAPWSTARRDRGGRTLTGTSTGRWQRRPEARSGACASAVGPLRRSRAFGEPHVS